jgi:hypothetical protein
VGLERGPLSLMSTIEELLGRNSGGSGLETENTAVGINCADYATPSIRKKLSLTSPTSGGRSVGIVCLWTKTTEVFFFCSSLIIISPSQWTPLNFCNCNNMANQPNNHLFVSR